MGPELLYNGLDENSTETKLRAESPNSVKYRIKNITYYCIICCCESRKESVELREEASEITQTLELL